MTPHVYPQAGVGFRRWETRQLYSNRARSGCGSVSQTYQGGPGVVLGDPKLGVRRKRGMASL